ncbi:PTS sugar transporter subunit IIA [Thioalkalivibrio paradoxus]|uniref:PTS mannose transporter subunit IIA n=1 Tax=Thioalkalivibrio paradoxus ARh 1 TaxID=713585 RepID=W0DR35_9GAMM|nr:PTS mannose transporter subunit IIA [Thioalkalivibrio paradoxus]AHE99315.1 PTS mannose transporter subunit IIA [Thioalkalivibrio paradoxus ARh 1]
MAVGLMLITHQHLGDTLLQTARSMLGELPRACEALAMSQNDDPDMIEERARARLRGLDHGDGVLIMTDMFGSTPANIAGRLAREPNRRVIAGVNLPMLVRVLNYRSLPLTELVNKAISGGHDGILLCDQECSDAAARGSHR